MSDLHDLLERESERFTFPVGAAERMFERGRRRARNRRIAALGVGAILFLAVLAILRSSLPGDRAPQPATPTPTDPGSVAGTYTVRLSADDPRIERLGLAGRYEMRLHADGVLELTSPKPFDLPGDPITFDVSNGEMTTDALVGAECDAPGTYGVGLRAGTLTFVPVDEPCELRRLLFASGPWTIVPTDPSSDPLEGEWTARFSCARMVRAVRRAPISAEDVAFWAGATGKELGSDDPADPCGASPEPLAYTLRFDEGRLLIFDRELREGFDGTYELRRDTITIADGSTDNILGRYRMTFRIDGDRVSFDLIGRGASDSFFVATWESAPFVKRS